MTPIIPMRPVMGARLTPQNILLEVLQMKLRGYIVQPKLNGDRGVLESTPTGLKLWNRYGTEYCAGHIDLTPWQALPPGIMLDGELYQQAFTPFEAIHSNNARLLFTPTTEGRIAGAKLACQIVHVPFLFNEPADDWLMEQVNAAENPRTRQWEGVVCKLRTTNYLPMKKPDHESPYWTKCKWY